jgi:hypothetical protein
LSCGVLFLRPGLAAFLALCLLAGVLLGAFPSEMSVVGMAEQEPELEPESWSEAKPGAKPRALSEPEHHGQRFDAEATAEEAQSRCLDMLKERLTALVTGDTDGLKHNYRLSSETGYWAWEREVFRNSYFQEWALHRGVTFTTVEADFEIDSTVVDDPSTVWIELTELARYEYVYNEGRLTHEFGSRSLHVAQMVREEGRWLTRLHWYVDPLGQECYSPAAGIIGPADIRPSEGSVPACGESIYSGGTSAGTGGTLSLGALAEQASGQYSLNAQQRFDREAALRYAIRHSGVRVFPDVERYNRHYRVYSYAGGDCANFVSQVLHAGGLEQGYGWHYTSEGSTAWVRSDSLIWFLLSSGTGERLYRGTFEGALTPTDEDPCGIVASLEPGDVIGYENDGELHHVAVVVGKDPKGYLTIGSHTSDRLFFPWDLGWDEDTVFWLVKITY